MSQGEASHITNHHSFSSLRLSAFARDFFMFSPRRKGAKKRKLEKLINQSKDIAPLITFRVLFGALMMFGAIRFMMNGWIERLYVEPQFFFKFYGFEWVEPLGETGMYLLFGLIALSAGLVMLGLFYRIAIITFFLTFTYVELIDATNYLNHYYLVCLLSLIMIFLPANRAFSLDVWLRPSLKRTQVPAWTINILILQLTIVYTFAGIAKLNPDWLFRAMPLSIWLPEHTDFPIIGDLFQYSWVAYAFSWGGAIYDLSIAFFLMHRKTRTWAYLAVIGFHLMTNMLFNIGLFPMIMISSTLIFFPANVHHRWLKWLGYKSENGTNWQPKFFLWKFIKPVFCIYLAIQLFLPIRYALYPSQLLWAEEGYRFSWRVMLVEKNGLTTFFVHDPRTGRKVEITNRDYLTLFQEKQMSIQPDFILQFAHFLEKEYQEKYQIENPIVTVESHVALNGRLSRQFIDPNVNLATIDDGFETKNWVLPFKR